MCAPKKTSLHGNSRRLQANNSQNTFWKQLNDTGLSAQSLLGAMSLCEHGNSNQEINIMVPPL